MFPLFSAPDPSIQDTLILSFLLSLREIVSRPLFLFSRPMDLSLSLVLSSCLDGAFGLSPFVIFALCPPSYLSYSYSRCTRSRDYSTRRRIPFARQDDRVFIPRFRIVAVNETMRDIVHSLGKCRTSVIPNGSFVEISEIFFSDSMVEGVLIERGRVGGIIFGGSV